MPDFRLQFGFAQGRLSRILYHIDYAVSHPWKVFSMLEIVKSFLSAEETRQSGVVQGQYYERSGACNQCGKCCTNIYLVYGQQTIDSIEMFEEVRSNNPEYDYFLPVQEEEGGVLFQCKQLQPDNTCGIYDQRPDFCRRYPSEHSLLMGGKLAEGCGYRFRLLQTFGQVLEKVSVQKDLNAGTLLP
jgi:Fe-S-cluster containining protein